MKFYKEYKYSTYYHDLGTCYTDNYSMMESIYQKEFNSKPSSFFDVGCGDGRIMNQAVCAGVKKVYGIEPFLLDSQKRRNIEHTIIEIFIPHGKYDLAWVNGPLCYIEDQNFHESLVKLHFAKMVIAKHATAEDVEYAAKHYNENLLDFCDFNPRSESWYLNAFKECGFKARIDHKHKCFVALSL